MNKKQLSTIWSEVSTNNDNVINYIIKLYLNRKKSIDKYTELSGLYKNIDHKDYFKNQSKLSDKHHKMLDKLIGQLGRKHFSVWNVKDPFWEIFDKLDNKKASQKLSKIYWSEHLFIQQLKSIYFSKETSKEIKDVLSVILNDILENRYYISKISSYKDYYDEYKTIELTKDILVSESKTYTYCGYE